MRLARLLASKTPHSLVARLVGEVAQILLHERAEFLRILLGLGLQKRGAVAGRKPGELRGTSGAIALAVGAAGTITPIPLIIKSLKLAPATALATATLPLQSFGGEVQWILPMLQPGETRTMELTTKTPLGGKGTHQFTAVYRGAKQSAGRSRRASSACSTTATTAAG